MNKKSLKESLPGCIGIKNPIPPNECSTCRFHSDPKIDCKDVKILGVRRR
jgi:hypothetical protein